MDITIAMIREKEFQVLHLGYDPEQVDMFLDEIVDTIEYLQRRGATVIPPFPRVTVKMIEEKEFHFVRAGYDAEEVDLFLDAITETYQSMLNAAAQRPLRTVRRAVAQSKKGLFLSYCQRDSAIADLVDSAISQRLSRFVTVARDIRDVKYRESFRKFMESIGQRDFVVMIVSDHYLKSRNCLYEVVEVMRNRDYAEKLLFIVLSDADGRYYGDEAVANVGAKVYDHRGHASYILHWQKRYDAQKRQIDEIDNPVFSIEQARELKVINRIQLDLPEFLDFLFDRNGIALSELIATDFQVLVEAIV